MSNLSLEIPREPIEQIAREVFESLQLPVVRDEEAERIASTLAKINAKQFITIREFSFLFGCCDGYVGKLLQRARDNATEHPVPYLDLDGLVTFDREAVIAWAREAKQLQKNQKKVGGKRGGHLSAVRKAASR